MLSQTYEIEHVRHELHNVAKVSMLTGLPIEELLPRLPPHLVKAHGWYSREFAQVFRSLGYDCAPDFKTKFDPHTTRPCLLRYGPTKMTLLRETVQRRRDTGKPTLKPDRWWGVLVYNQGLVYCPDEAGPFLLEHLNPAFKVTSMMQVWISDL